MKKILIYSSWINIIGFSLSTLSLILFIWIKPLAWGDFYLLIDLLISAPFFIAGIVVLKNIPKPQKDKIQNALIIVILALAIPSLVLPFTFELGGLIICLLVFVIGYLAIVKIKSSTSKMMYINTIGFFFLVFILIFIFKLIQFES
ncbi:hypothetical protein [Persicobacter diffluens]|uniref:Uncharacterized protein n=1 Tax=Persicobacter diffluens TaxID=981 RepID=A0AAN4W4I6_9BACT|nr:hypothetical protein PEDI_44720 [Persicobacter diffluens]